METNNLFRADRDNLSSSVNSRITWDHEVIPAGESTLRLEPYHKHPHHELLLITAGHVTALTPHGRYSHSGACLLLYRAQRAHTQVNRPGVYERFYFWFPPDYKGIPASATTLLSPSRTEDAVLLPLATRAAQELASVARILLELEKQPDADERKRLLTGYILSEMAERWRLHENAPRHTEAPYLADVTAFVAAHLGEKLTIERLAEAAGVGRTKLTGDFRAYLGMSVNQYITQTRINRARALLEAGESVDHTAERCGFADSGYFIRVFRQYEQTTPLRYRTARRE